MWCVVTFPPFCKHLETLSFLHYSVLELINGTVIHGGLVILLSPGSWIRSVAGSLENRTVKW